jgi:SAM-dependent methyltransferase
MPPAECIACGRASALPWRAARPSDARLASRSSYDLLRCTDCGTAAVAPGQRDLEGPGLYTDGSYRERGRLEPLLEPLRRLIDRDRLRAIGCLPAHADVLEIGAGDGRLLAALAERGHRVAGIEPSAPYAASARARGLDVAAVPIEAADEPSASRDAVLLWHVLEHLDDPAGALQRARAWLRPGGTLVVAVPNRASWQASLGGDRWFHQDVPRHLTHFTPRGLAALLERCGFRATRTRHLLLEHNLLGMWLTLLNRVTGERDVPFRLLKRMRRATGARPALDAALVALLGPVLIPVAVALEGLAGVLRRGGTIVVLAS